tara:strand:+ start:500 stop:2458 length:1959 start_codon:yes stop_codon:yes gene_type:complete
VTLEHYHADGGDRSDGAGERRRRRFVQLLDSLPRQVGVVEIPPDDSDILHVALNHMVGQWYGLPLSQLEGKWALQDMGAPREVVMAAIPHYRRAQRSGTWVEYTERIPPGPASEELLVQVTLLHLGPGDEGRERFGFLAVDDTARLQAVERLRASEERLRLAARSAHFGTFDFDFLTETATWSPDLWEIMGRKPRENVEPAAMAEWTHPDDREELFAGLQRAAIPHADSRPAFEYRIVRPDGTIRWLRGHGMSVTAEIDGEMRSVRIVGVVQDITEERAAKQALEEADRHKNEFLALLAHEIRNPIAALQTGLELVSRSKGPVKPIVVETMQGQLRQIARLTEDLLDVGRISKGQLELRFEPTDLAEVWAAAMEAARPLAAERSHRLELLVADDTRGKYVVDGARLTQMVGNLLVNAVKHTPAGGRVRLEVSRDDATLHIRVADDGPGIPAEHRENIFTMFVQAPSAAGDGLGLGLTLVRQLALLHGGNAWLDSADQGSTFAIALPLVPAEEAGAVETLEAPSPDGRTVLVADDHCSAAHLLGMVLELEGHRVLTAGNGREALAVMEKVAVDVAILDLDMPVMDGRQAARAIRQLPRHAETLLIALSGWGREHDQKESSEAGFDHHLVKPAPLDDLVALIARTPGRRRRAKG